MRVEPKPIDQKVTTPTFAKPKRRRVRSWKHLILLIFLLGGTALVALTMTLVPKRYNMLVIGSDQRGEERGRSDVLMVVSLSKSPKDAISVVTIPRDTRVDVDGFGMQKITHAYALGERDDENSVLGNASLTRKTVEDLLDINIDGTLEVTFKGFSNIIDSLGGIQTESMGHLDGEEALAIVRDRYREGGDFARTEDQREIIVQTIRTVRSQNAFSSVLKLLEEGTESRITLSKTKFALFAAYAVVRRGGNVSLEGVHNDVVPGRGESLYTPEFGKALYYWVPDEAKTREMVDQWLS